MAVLALGHVHEANLPGLVQELADIVRETLGTGGKLRGRVRREDLRLYVGHIWRQVWGGVGRGGGDVGV